jgi:hypothetical protein
MKLLLLPKYDKYFVTGKQVSNKVLELVREPVITRFNIYEGIIGCVISNDEAKNDPNTVSININDNGKCEVYILPKKDFIDIYDIEEIQKASTEDFNCIKKYHIQKENYEILAKIKR